MQLIKPLPALLAVWRLRLVGVSILPAFVSACFATYINWIWWLCTCAWILAFLYLYIFYYPIKLKKLAFGSNNEYLLIHCGVIYTRVKAIPFSSIQYINVVSTPLGRLFGVYSLTIHAAGANAYMPGLSHEQALSLQHWLADQATPGAHSNQLQPIEKPDSGTDGAHA